MSHGIGMHTRRQCLAHIGRADNHDIFVFHKQSIALQKKTNTTIVIVSQLAVSFSVPYLQCLPVEADVQVMLQVCQQGLTNDDVIWAGVVV